MYGAILGDFIVNKKCTSNTVLTVAVMKAIINKIEYKESIEEYISKYDFEHPNLEWNDEPSNVNILNFISPIGYMFDNEFDIVENIRKLAVLNKSVDMINSAIYMSLIILYARKGISKEVICRQLDLKLHYIEEPISVQDNFTNILYTLFNANHFEEAIGNSSIENISIISPMAEALYGIPDYLKENNNIPNEFIKVLRRG